MNILERENNLYLLKEGNQLKKSNLYLLKLLYEKNKALNEIAEKLKAIEGKFAMYEKKVKDINHITMDSPVTINYFGRDIQLSFADLDTIVVTHENSRGEKRSKLVYLGYLFYLY